MLVNLNTKQEKQPNLPHARLAFTGHLPSTKLKSLALRLKYLEDAGFLKFSN